MSDPFLQPGGEPSRPLPPYRPAVPSVGYQPLPAPVGPAFGMPLLPAPAASHLGSYGLPQQPPGYQNAPPPVTAPVTPPVERYATPPSTPYGNPPPSTPPRATPAAAQEPQLASAGAHSPVSAAPAPAQPGTTRVGMSTAIQAGDIDLEIALRQMVEAGGSDLHLTVGTPPMIRVDGALQPLPGYERLSDESLKRTIYAALSQRQRETFEDELELDFAYSVRGLARFRVNLYKQRESVGAAFRVIPYEIKPIAALGLPPMVSNFAGLPRGLVLVTGPTGSGKSTTLASIIDLANTTRAEHIMTVEDPIEFLHRHKKAMVNQRQVGSDTHSFARALKHVLRQDPDIILIGEMRDLETISVALTAAETGHLVFATLHTQDAAQSIDRIIDVFPAEQQDQVRTQLAGTLQAIVSQTLCRRSDGPGRALAAEVLIATPAIRNLIREGKTHQIYSALQAGAKLGMTTMDQHLAELVRMGRISYETALEKCHHVEDFNRLVGRAGGTTQGANTAMMTGGIGSSQGNSGSH